MADTEWWRTAHDQTLVTEARAELDQAADDLAQMQAGWDAVDTPVHPKGLTMASAPPTRHIPTDQAVTFSRHVKAALMHLVCAEDTAEAAGIALDAPVQSDPDYPLAALIRGALDAVEDLDMWAVNNAVATGATRTAYAGTEHWCHRPGGVLPVDGTNSDLGLPLAERAAARLYMDTGGELDAELDDQDTEETSR